jgi:hypothetical protein
MSRFIETVRGETAPAPHLVWKAVFRPTPKSPASSSPSVPALRPSQDVLSRPLLPTVFAYHFGQTPTRLAIIARTPTSNTMRARIPLPPLSYSLQQDLPTLGTKRQVPSTHLPVDLPTDNDENQ